MRNQENNFLPYSNVNFTSAFKYGDKWVLRDKLPHLIFSDFSVIALLGFISGQIHVKSSYVTGLFLTHCIMFD